MACVCVDDILHELTRNCNFAMASVFRVYRCSLNGDGPLSKARSARSGDILSPSLKALHIELTTKFGEQPFLVKSWDK